MHSTCWVLDSVHVYTQERKYTVEPPLTATSLQRSLFLSRRTKNPYLNSCLKLFTTATSLQRQRPLKRGRTAKKNISTTASILSYWWKSQEWSRNLIRMTRWWLIVALVFWLCCIYTAPVSINCPRYLSWMLWTLLALSRSNFDSKHCSRFLCILSLYILLYMIKLSLLDTVSMIIIYSNYFFVPDWLKSHA